MAWRRSKQLDVPADESVANVLARLDAVVDRLEGVYEHLAPMLDQPTKGRADDDARPR